MTPPSKHASWEAYWGPRQEAFVGEGVETHPRLDAFWRAALDETRPGAHVLDVACGGGSISKRADPNRVHLFGLDVARSALAEWRKACQGQAVSASASAMPFRDAAFDFVGSQFGGEYAGLKKAVEEGARVLAPGGRLLWLVHCAGGALEIEVTARLNRIDDLALDRRFIPAARSGFQALWDYESGRRSERSATADLQAFKSAVGRLEAAMAREQGDGLTQHLYQGVRQLFERRENYAPEDIASWLDGMESEIRAYRARMAAMREAAADTDAIGEAFAMLRARDCDGPAPHAFHLKDDDPPAAWILDVSRAA